jgi:hypothetical protein
MPPQLPHSAKNKSEADWSILSDEAGVDLREWAPDKVQGGEPFYADETAAWRGSFPDMPGIYFRIEAAAFQGKPIYFEIIGPLNWTEPTAFTRFDQVIYVYIAGLSSLLPIAIGGIFFARRNLRLGRGDRRNATRLAVLVGVGMSKST